MFRFGVPDTSLVGTQRVQGRDLPFPYSLELCLWPSLYLRGWLEAHTPPDTNPLCLGSTPSLFLARGRFWKVVSASFWLNDRG